MFRGAFGTAALRIVSNGLGFATSVILARALGSTGYGIYAIAFAWTGLLTVPAVLGLDQLLIRGMAGYHVQERWGEAHGLLRRAHELVLGTSLLIVAAGCAVALVGLSTRLRVPFAVAMALVPITALTFLRQGALQALGHIVVSQLPEYIVRPLVALAALGAVLLAGRHALTPTRALVIAAGATGIACAIGARQLRRALPDSTRHARPRFHTRAWLSSSLPMMLISGIWLANAYAGTVLVGSLAGSRSAGIYAVVDKGASLIVLVLTAANTPLAPAIARLTAHGRRDELERVVQRVARLGFLVSVPICAGLAIAPNLFLSTFGSGFHGGATAMRIVACGQLVNAFAGPCGNVLLMSGQERAALVGIALGLLTNVALALALVPSLGVTGGAIAFAASLVVWNTAFTVIARRRVGINATALRALAMVDRRSRA
jgi:O-antigen/teichoic acid export membrane protein